jgi:prepilin peptidase CpaA
MNWQVSLAIFIGLVASAEDLRSRQIPNWIPVTAVAGGLTLAGFEAGWRGLGSALLGMLLGFAVFFLFYALGGMGGGDVKLMAGFGAVLGVAQIWQAAIWTALIGGVAALVAAGWSAWRARRGQASSVRESIPYGPAIALGAWLTLWGRT